MLANKSYITAATRASELSDDLYTIEQNFFVFERHLFGAKFLDTKRSTEFTQATGKETQKSQLTQTNKIG